MMERERDGERETSIAGMTGPCVRAADESEGGTTQTDNGEHNAIGPSQTDSTDAGDGAAVTIQIR